MNFGERLKILRKEHNLTQAELANQTNISLRTISSYEKSVAAPKNTRNLIKIEKVLNAQFDCITENNTSNLASSIRAATLRNPKHKGEILAQEIGLYFRDENISKDEKLSTFLAIQKKYWSSNK